MIRHRPLAAKITEEMDKRCLSAWALASTMRTVTENDVRRSMWGDPTLADRVYVQVARELGLEVKL
jgi:hypothetical protein